MPRYRVNTGMNYPGPGGKEKRAEPGDVVSDLPASSAEWLLRDGHISPADGPAPVPKPEPTPEA